MTADLRALPGVARAAIDAALRGLPYRPAPLDAPHDAPHGVFVTLRTRSGDLRGCIGHILPVHPTVTDEVAECAVLAASQDPRFPPLEPHELADVTLEVSVLTPPERAHEAALDPRRYGVVVSAGRRKGVLLPDLEGVDTVEEQLRIALRKAGIHRAEPFTVERFEVIKLEE